MIDQADNVFDLNAVLHPATAFNHPRDGRRMEFTAILPPDLQDVLDALPGWRGREEAKEEE